MNELAEQLFASGVAMNKAVAETFRAAEWQHRVVYLVWCDAMSEPSLLLAVCGTKARAEQEAADLGHALNAVLRIEPRVVHS